jgi:hypothetical protein
VLQLHNMIRGLKASKINSKKKNNFMELIRISTTKYDGHDFKEILF